MKLEDRLQQLSAKIKELRTAQDAALTSADSLSAEHSLNAHHLKQEATTLARIVADLSVDQCDARELAVRIIEEI